MPLIKSKIVANLCLAKVGVLGSVMEDVDGHIFPFHEGQRRNQKWLQTLNFGTSGCLQSREIT